MGRSSKKGPYIDPSVYKHIMELNRSGERRVIKTWARDCTIFPEMVGHTVGVHDGRRHVPIYVTENMVNHKLGEFAPTRRFPGHVAKSERASGPGKRK